MISFNRLRMGAGILVILIALLHVAHPTYGVRGLLIYVQAGTPFIDPRPIAFTLSGLGLLVGVVGVWRGIAPRRPAYAAGILMIATYLVGYVVWHLTGHGAFWPGIEGHAHGGNPVSIIVDHLMADEWERTAKTLEAITIGLLSYLYLTDIRTAEKP